MTRSAIRLSAPLAVFLAGLAVFVNLSGSPVAAAGTATTEGSKTDTGATADAGPVKPTGPTGPAQPVAVAPTAGHPGAGKTRRVRARLKIRRTALRGSVLSARLSISPLVALAVQVRVRVRTQDGRREIVPVRVSTSSAPVLRFRVTLPPGSRPTRLTARYPGDQQVRPQKVIAPVRAPARSG